MNLAKLIFKQSRSYYDKPAVIFEGQACSYRNLEERAGSYMNLLIRLGVNAGDRIAILFPKCMEFIYLHLAALLLGAVTLPLNPDYRPEEVAYFLDDSGSRFFFADPLIAAPGLVKAAQKRGIRIIMKENGPSGHLASLLTEDRVKAGAVGPALRTAADDTALLCYTSGTTGRPKGAMITHRNLIFNALALREVWQWTHQDVLLHVLPLFHVHGLCVALLGGLSAGSTIVVHEKFDALKSLTTIKNQRCTMFMAVPTIYYRLLEAWGGQRADLSSMRVFISGSAPLSETLFTEFYSATGFRILERYGLTETQMVASNPYEPERRIPGSVGYPLPGVRIRITDDSGRDCRPGERGEVLVRGENVFKGYWKKPEKTGEAFCGDWFRTGDVGFLDEKDEMRLYLVGRSKELIISGGYNIYPREVEEVLNRHEAVREAAVVGIFNREYGEIVAAAVVPGQGAALSEEDLIMFCKHRLVGYKCPRRILFLETLPRNAMGKIQKTLIRDMFASQ